MSLAALILADEDCDQSTVLPLMLRIAGQSLLERQVRQAILAGANHIIIMVAQLPVALMAEIDRLSAEKLPVVLVRSAQEAANHVHPDEDVLLFFGPLILENQQIDAIVASPGPVLLTIPASGDRERFERIDANYRWSGFGKIAGKILRETASGLGDWAFGPTLLRQAIQHGAQYHETANVLRAETGEDVTSAFKTLFDGGNAGPALGWFDQLAGLLAKPTARFVAARNITGQHASILALSIYIIALLCIFYTEFELSYLAFALAAWPVLCAVQIDLVSVKHRPIQPVILEWRWLLFVVIVAADASYHLLEISDKSIFIIDLWMISNICLLRLLPVASSGQWRTDTGGLAVILAISGFAGFPVPGLALCTLLLTGEMALRLWTIRGTMKNAGA